MVRPLSGLKRPTKKISREEIQEVQEMYLSLQKVERFVEGRTEEAAGLQELMAFARRLKTIITLDSVADQFDQLQPLRSWLFWPAISFLTRTNADASVIVLLAHFYAAALAVEPLFPDAGGTYFASLSMGPLEQLINAFEATRATQHFGYELQIGSDLMEFPTRIYISFRSRMGWLQQSTPAYPALQACHSPYGDAFTSLEIDSDSNEQDLRPDELHATYSEGNEWLKTEQLHSPALLDMSQARHRLAIPPPFEASLSEYDASALHGFGYAGDRSPLAEEDQTCPLATMAQYAGGFVPPALWT
ncbi:MAG: hypothetical protein M1825_004601 [Sarcosagium campestre]|nr:MAG: hypothetical protein M1825_004601 [Sarcosagium campestre]